MEKLSKFWAVPNKNGKGSILTCIYTDEQGNITKEAVIEDPQRLNCSFNVLTDNGIALIEAYLEKTVALKGLRFGDTNMWVKRRIEVGVPEVRVGEPIPETVSGPPWDE